MDIEVEGKKYKVIENLGWEAGYQAKIADDNGYERVAVKRGGKWTWWQQPFGDFKGGLNG